MTRVAGHIRQRPMPRQRMRHSGLRRPLSIIALLGLVFVQAPGIRAQADSIQAERALRRAAIAHADSAGDLAAAFEARLQLAGVATRTEAAGLLQQAASLADSMARPDLGAMAHRLLARRHAAAGQFGPAYAQSVIADSLDRLRELHEAAAAERSFSTERQRLVAGRDSIARLGAERERTMAMAIAELQEKADRWLVLALAMLLLGLLLVVWLLYRAGRATTKLQGTIGELRQELETLKRHRQAPPLRTVTSDAPSRAVDQAMKPVVEGHFRRTVPERLATLREARRRGDADKVLRVVASLKPQLLAFDADRFGPLIERLRMPGAAAHADQWAADLDALEKALEEWTFRNGAQ